MYVRVCVCVSPHFVSFLRAPCIEIHSFIHSFAHLYAVAWQLLGNSCFNMLPLCVNLCKCVCVCVYVWVYAHSAAFVSHMHELVAAACVALLPQYVASVAMRVQHTNNSNQQTAPIWYATVVVFAFLFL